MKYHEIRLDGDGKLDDIVLQCDSLHLERLDDGLWWLAVYQGAKRTVIHLNGRMPVTATLVENELGAPVLGSQAERT